jgi:hypothetical protein
MKTCNDYQLGLTRRLQGDCNSLEEKELQNHLRECDTCRQYWEGLQADDALLRQFATSCDPIVARIRTRVSQQVSRMPQSAPRVVHRKYAWVRYAIAASLIGGVLIMAAVILQNTQSIRTTAQNSHPNQTLKDIPYPTVKGTPPSTDNLGNMEPLPIKLPVAMYRDTPQNLKGIANLEPPRGTDRPPFYAPKGAFNVALGKPVTLNDDDPILGESKFVTDGNKNATEGSFIEMGPFPKFATIDLQGEFELYAIVVWHFHLHPRSYRDVVVQVSMDPEFTKPITLFNNDTDNSLGLGAGTDKHYVDTNEGRLVDAKGNRARYVRVYTNGNNENELNHLIEVEAWGKPVEDSVKP